MINLNELRSFQIAAVPNESELYKKRWRMSPMVVTLKDGQRIPVLSTRQIIEGMLDDYSYCIHPEFGVLRYLGRNRFDKSPLCCEIEKTIEEMI